MTTRGERQDIGHPTRDGERPGTSAAERRVASRLAREMAKALERVAQQIETDNEPVNLLHTVHRVRMALAGLSYKPETYARLVILEVLHRATSFAEIAAQTGSDRRGEGGRSTRHVPPLAGDALAAVMARGQFEGACPGLVLDDPAAWAEMLTEWRIGRGAPLAATKRRWKAEEIKSSKWDRLAKLLKKYAPSIAKADGRTLKSEWLAWRKGTEHMAITMENRRVEIVDRSKEPPGGTSLVGSARAERAKGRKTCGGRGRQAARATRNRARK